MVGSAITPTTFSITKSSNDYTISELITQKCNGLAFFKFKLTTSSAITNTQGVSVAVFDNPSAFIGDGSIPLTILGSYDLTVANVVIVGWINIAGNAIYIRSANTIPANSNLYISGSFPCKQ